MSRLADAHAAFLLGSGPSTLCLGRTGHSGTQGGQKTAESESA